VKEAKMKKLSIAAAAAALTVATAAAAHDTTTVYPSRGACEAASAHMSNEERDWVLASFPDLFSSPGEVSSFLTRAFTCDPGPDKQWSITDHIEDVLGSDWFQHRQQ
jgi:hypothetical protein